MISATDHVLEESRPQSALIGWIDVDPLARLILYENLVLQWCNAAGRALLDAGRILVLRNGAVRPRNLTRVQSFVEFIVHAGAQPSIYCLPDVERESHLLMTCRRLDSSLVGLTAYSTNQGADYRWADLGLAFGLTSTERKITEALNSGHTADAAAEMLHLSVKTVRTHIRHIYSKLGVSSREMLFHKLRLYMMVQ